MLVCSLTEITKTTPHLYAQVLCLPHVAVLPPCDCRDLREQSESRLLIEVMRRSHEQTETHTDLAVTRTETQAQ